MTKTTLARALSLAAVLTACAADQGTDRAPIDEGDATSVQAQSEVPSYDVQKIFPVLSNARLSGSLCPTSATTFRSGSPGVFSVTNLTQLYARGDEQSGTCRLDFDVAVPPNLRFAKPSFSFGGTNFIDDESTKSTVAIRYAINDGPWLEGGKRTLNDARYGEFVLNDHAPLTGGACCTDQPRTFRVSVEMSASIVGRGELTLANVEGSFLYPEAVEWSACPGYSVVAPVPRKDGQPCGTNEPLCEPALHCEMTTASEGTCVDPSKRVAAVALGQACGGVRAIACVAPAICHYESGELAYHKVLGTCRLPTASVDEPCAGSPSIGCGTDAICSLDDICEPHFAGMPIAPGADCTKRGSVCQGDYLCVQHGEVSRCERAPVQIDQPCDLTKFQGCSRGLTCSDQTKTCLPDNPGQQGSRCRPAIGDCNTGLRCDPISKSCVR